MTTEREKRRRAVEERLFAWQPEATDVMRAIAVCPKCRSSLYLTYIVPVCKTRTPLDKTLEYCGYYCGSCHFAEHGARKKLL